MPTATRVAKRSLMNYTSAGRDQLRLVIELYFRTGVPDLDFPDVHEVNIPDLFWKADETGFHVSGRLDGQDFHPSDGTAWMRQPRSGGETHVEILTMEIDAWLSGLDHGAKSRIGSMLTEEAYTRDPGLSLTGFTARSGASGDPKHRVLTIVPGWV